MRHDFRLTANQPQGPLAADAVKVAQDMESIFGGAAHRPAETAPDPVVPIAKAGGAEPRSWFWAVTMVALAGLLIAGGTAWMAFQPQMVPHTAPRTVAPLQVAAATAPVKRPPASGLREAPAPAPAIAPSDIKTTKTEPVAIASPAKPKAAPQRARASDGNILDDRFNPRIRASRLYPDIAAADRELREAYARAEFVGLDPKLLRMFRDRWWQVRKDVEPDPAYAIEAYYQLARELDAARRRS